MYGLRGLALVFLLPFALANTIQKPDIVVPASAEADRESVRKIFKTSYEAYRTYAYGHDDLAPLSKSYRDSRNGWGASFIDAASTAKIMGFDTGLANETNYFQEAVNFAKTIDFSKSKTDDLVSVFETTIRYLAGLVSMYEMSEDAELLKKAQEVADKMAYAWVGDNEVPYGHINFTSNTPRAGNSNIAEAGTLIMEWGALAKYTGNQTYLHLAQKAMNRILKNPTPLPALAPQGINPATGHPVGGYLTWGGGSDSYFEYLIKYARLDNTEDPLYADMWATAVDSSIHSLLKTSSVGGHVYLADMDDKKNLRYVSSHLACFHGGNWLMGGRLLRNETIVKIALQLTDACWNTYASTATGIGPEYFAFLSSDSNATVADIPTKAQQKFYEKHGFYILDGYYILRPEVLESNFYAYRVTGDVKYYNRAREAVRSFEKYLRASVAYSPIWNVDDKKSKRWDSMESFWFAEVLKYVYLTFDEPGHISLDEYVFNTEAHPFKAPPAKEVYGSGKLYKNSAPFVVQGGELPSVSAVPSAHQTPPFVVQDGAPAQVLLAL